MIILSLLFMALAVYVAVAVVVEAMSIKALKSWSKKSLKTVTYINFRG